MLHLFRKRRRQAVEVHLFSSYTLRLYKNLVSLTLRESHDFVFNGWTVSRSLTYDFSSIERRAMHILSDYFMSLFVSKSYPAVLARPIDFFIVEGEWKHLFVSILHFQFIKVQRTLSYSSRSSCLHSSHVESILPEFFA